MDLDLFRTEFARNFTERGELGASVSLWQDGAPVLDLASGYRDREQTVPWTVQTPVLFWSATKGPAAACVFHACAAHGVELDRPVAGVWPEFAAAGKSAITLTQLLSHQAGLPALSLPVAATDHAAVAAALAREAPAWPPGTAHGYHPRTWGYLVDEVVRRVAGVPLGDYWRDVFAAPHGLDLWIGMPPERVHEVAPIFPPRRGPARGDPFYTAYLTAGSLTARSFASPRGLTGPAAMNDPAMRAASFPAFGGIGTAHALAKFYSLLASGGPFFDERMSRLLVQGPDLILLTETAFSTGFMKDPVDAAGRKRRTVFGPSLSAFGQPGAGGSHAFADPEHRLAFAYVMNQMEPGVLPNEKSLRLVEAAYAGS